MEEFLISEASSLIIVFLCLVSSAIFSGAETAVTSLGILKTRHMMDKHGKSVAHLELWAEHPGRVLTTVLLFNNMVNILASSVISQIATRYFASGALGIATGVSTFLVLLFGEIIPKSVAKANSEKLAVVSMRFIITVYYISYPLVILLSSLANHVVKIFSKGTKIFPLITEEEIEFMVSEGEKAGVIKDIKKEIIEGAFEFDETKVKEIMTPRPDLIALESQDTIASAIEATLKSGYSRLPVFKDTIDRIVGIVIAKDLLNYAHLGKQNLPISDIMREVFFVPESKSLMAVFKDLKRSKSHIAIVIDEYGGTAGIVTLEDILEEIVGDIQDEHDAEEARVLEVSENTFEVAGSISLDEFIEYFNLEGNLSFEKELTDDIDTLAGLFTKLVEQMPEIGQTKELANLKMEVLEVDNKRIDLFKITKITNEKNRTQEI